MSTETKPAEIKISELSIENESLKTQLADIKKALDETQKALKTANDVIEGDLKARLATKIMANSKYTIEDLSKMSVDELKGVEKVLVMGNAPFKGIRPAGTTDDAEGLTVPNLFKFGKKGEP